MSVFIKAIYECPNCQSPISSSSRPDSCPACNYDFKEVKDLKGYQYPLTLTEQKAKLEGKESEGKLYYDALIDMPTNKARDMMNDALNLMQVISAKNCDVSDIREVISMGIRIGEISRAYHNFLKTSAKHVPSLYQSSSSKGDLNNEQPKNGAGENPS